MKRKILALCLIVSMLAVAIIGSTLAFFTDTDKAVNTFIVGDIDIEIKETFTDNSTIYPGVEITKAVSVENVGANDAYTRVIITLPKYVKPVWSDSVGEAKAWTVVDESADANEVAYTLEYNTALAAGAVTPTCLDKVIIDKYANYADISDAKGSNFEVPVFAEAIQAAGFADADAAFEALDAQKLAEAGNNVASTADELAAALEEGGEVILTSDITNTNNTQIIIPEGVTVTLDMNGKTFIGGNYDATSNDAGYILVNNGTLIINGDDQSVFSANGLSNGYGAILNKGTLTLNGGTYTGSVWDGTAGDTPGYTIRNQGTMTVNGDTKIHGTFGSVSNPGGNLTINGGTFTNDDLPGVTNYLVSVWSNGTIVINDGDFTFTSTDANAMGSPVVGAWDGGTIEINGGTFDAEQGAMGYGSAPITIKGGTFKNAAKNVFGNSAGISVFVPTGYEAKDNGDGTWSVAQKVTNVTAPAGNTAVENRDVLYNAIDTAESGSAINLAAGEYKMPSVNNAKVITITGTEDTVIDLTWGAYMDSSTVSFEGVTIKGSTGYVTTNGSSYGSDYAALYTPNVTYTDCSFVGAFRVGRDGAKFINCSFDLSDGGYVWVYGHDVTFENCEFNTAGKAILVYSDGLGADGISEVVVKNCKFNATTGAKAGAINNQNCAAIEIDNFGNGAKVTASGNTYSSNFSGEWRIKSFDANKNGVTVNGTAYTTLALDGKTMTIDGDKNVTVNP